MEKLRSNVQDAAAELADRYAPFARYSESALESAFALARRRLPPSGLAVDIGAGTGAPAKIFKRLAPSFALLAIDASPAMLAQCQLTRVFDQCLNADASDLPIEDASVDLAYCVEALHLFENKPACLAEMARALRPGGVALIVGTTRADLAHQLFHRLLPRFHALDAPRHFESSELCEWATDAGMTCVEYERLAYSVRFTSGGELEEFLATRPFFSLQQMSAGDLSADLEDLRARVTNLPPGAVESRSVMSALVFAKP